MKRRRFWLLAVVFAGCLGLASAWVLYFSLETSVGSRSASRFAYQHPSASAELPNLWRVPEFSFRDQHDTVTPASSLLGTVWIADFIFSTCSSVCPMLTARLVSLQRRLPQQSLRFVSFSVDPEHDTPKVLAEYASKWSSGERRWLLLSTDERGLAELSQGMRVALEPTGELQNPILHTSMFFLVDVQGTVRGVYDSNDPGALERLVVDAQRLVAATAPPDATPQIRPALPRDGAGLFMELRCGACHDDPRLAPNLAGVYESRVRLSDGSTLKADESYLRESIVEPERHLVLGYPNLMPSYRREVDDAQIQALVDYIKGLRPHPAGTMGASPHAVESPSSGSAGAMGQGVSIDPVCGMQVHIGEATPQAPYQGRTRYFCCEACRSRFEKDPGKYVK